VASTKAFTTQLAALFTLTLVLAKLKGRLAPDDEARHLEALRHLPGSVQHALNLEPQIRAWSEQFAHKAHALFLGRGIHYPIALEGALKLKEISYIHAEAYPAGELKHGPLALVDETMPVVVIAPNDALLEKVKSNMQEVRARGGELYVFADLDSHFTESEGVHVIRTPRHAGVLSPVVHAIPVQLLAYNCAIARGTDVDKPRTQVGDRQSSASPGTGGSAHQLQVAKPPSSARSPSRLCRPAARGSPEGPAGSAQSGERAVLRTFTSGIRKDSSPLRHRAGTRSNRRAHGNHRHLRRPMTPRVPSQPSRGGRHRLRLCELAVNRRRARQSTQRNSAQQRKPSAARLQPFPPKTQARLARGEEGVALHRVREPHAASQVIRGLKGNGRRRRRAGIPAAHSANTLPGRA
jgi:hypothetical protein